MAFKIEYNELIILIQALGHDTFTARVVAEYLDECIDYELNLSYYLWNTLKSNVKVFKTKEEAVQYVNDNLCCELSDCTIYEGFIGTYLEWR